MRNRATVLAVMVAFVVSLFPGNHASASPTQIITYTQHYDCIIGPVLPDDVVGEWTQLCNNSWVGWGWRPGDSCTYTVQTVEGDC